MTRTRRNKFHAWCSTCGDSIAAGRGYLLGKDASDYWKVRCTDCEGTSSRGWREPPRPAAPPPYPPFVAPCLRTLGLTPPVDRTAVKRRYRELALAHHPDRVGDSGRFMEVESAYRSALALVGGGT